MSFNPLATDFDLQNAIFLANISNLVYLDESQIRQQLQLSQNLDTNFAFVSSKKAGFDAEAMILADKQAIIIAFRGTEKDSSADWVSNLDNRFLPKFGGNVHHGFWDTLAQIWDEIASHLDNFRTQNQPIWLTGHSQGGALAMLTANILQQYQILPQGIYTYGQPKVGDMLFASQYNTFLAQKTFRLYNVGDSVPNNPPAYYHAGTAVEITEKGEINIRHDFNFLESGNDSITSVLDALFDFATTSGANAHTLTEYLKRLQMQ